MSAMSRSSTPHKTKFAYTRLPISVTHQPVPPNARIALKASKPATMNIMRAAKVTIRGLLATAPPERIVGSLIPPGIGSLCCAIDSLLSVFVPLMPRFVDRLLDLFRLCPDLLLHLLLRASSVPRSPRGLPGGLNHGAGWASRSCRLSSPCYLTANRPGDPPSFPCAACCL